MDKSFPGIRLFTSSTFRDMFRERDELLKRVTIGKAVSYIDKITEESIPTLSVGTCIFSGIATPIPLKLRIEELPAKQKPDSLTQKFEDIINRGDEQASKG